MSWIKVDRGCYQSGCYSVEYDYEVSEKDDMQWNVYVLGLHITSVPTLRIGKSMADLHDRKGHC
jgi:hypothetical protein